MENNKLLIGVQFTFASGAATGKKHKSASFELYVLRDITFGQLLDGIRYGLEKAFSESPEAYGICGRIFGRSMETVKTDPSGREYYPGVLLSCHNPFLSKLYSAGKRNMFYVDEKDTPICDLGFITASNIIFDESGTYVPPEEIDTKFITKAFSDKNDNEIVFPEFNVSSRQLYAFNDAAMEILAPSEAPQRDKNGILSTLLPSVLSIVVMMVIRMAFSGGGTSMVIMSAAMGLVGVITGAINWVKSQKAYKQSVIDWRTHYQDYIDSLMADIKTRQQADVKKLDELYPDPNTLISPGDSGVFAVNDNIFSRYPSDEDFMTFRLGLSDDVPSKFPINGSSSDTVFSQSFFTITEQGGNDHVKLYISGEEGAENVSGKQNLCKLPSVISARYSKLKNAPMLYSLKQREVLGIVDPNMDSPDSQAQFFINRMILELSYYHTPENLQFVVFFNKSNDYGEIKKCIDNYMFMPHFRGLFQDRAQFVFDDDSAGVVLSSLLQIISARDVQSDDEEAAVPVPHIVFVVLDNHDLFEHAFAEYINREAGYSGLALSFVFAAKYKEYLPAYCDDIIYFGKDRPLLVPHENSNAKVHFSFGKNAADTNWEAPRDEFNSRIAGAYRILSSLHYAQITQNGKVPSSVSAYRLFDCDDSNVKQKVLQNWGLTDKERGIDVTKRLSALIGCTENGTEYLDLHEKGDGPHMLVAGTTGSGKTETIITYLVGLCMNYTPKELNLLLVDMKGGGFTKRIGHLPHVVGAVTDVDGDENGTGAEYMLGRFLGAMKAEIKRRKILFNKLHVDSIDSYIKACRDIESFIIRKGVDEDEANEMRATAKNEPLPHLILVVDEFTELKRMTGGEDGLDFMGEITTIARVGRSLGMHIILISQNIEGAITDDIRVNSRVRLCLKVATKQASKEMLGTDVAASPYMPGYGRAYMLIGTGTRFTYFQSGFTGTNTDEAFPVNIIKASRYGTYPVFYDSNEDNLELKAERKRKEKEGTMRTQLEGINEAICSAYDVMKSREDWRPHIIFTKPLPDKLLYDREKDRAVEVMEKKGGKKQ